MVSRHSAATEELALRLIGSMSAEGIKQPAPDALHYLSKKLATAIQEDFGRLILPESNQTSVVTLHAPKTAAFFFDRVWGFANNEDVEGGKILFRGGTDVEIWLLALVVMANSTNDDRRNFDSLEMLENSPLVHAFELVEESDKFARMERVVAGALKQSHGIAALPMFSSCTAQREAYAMGDRRTLVASLMSLRVIDENQLSWSQVIQAREDSETIAKIRALRHWADLNMEGKPLNFVTDAIGCRLDDYERGLRKHGIKTVLGCIQSLLDPKFLVATAAIGTGLGAGLGHEWGIGGAILAVLGKTACSISEKFLELTDARQGEGAEVAFVHDMKECQEKN
jgi:hypothetical protein